MELKPGIFATLTLLNLTLYSAPASADQGQAGSYAGSTTGTTAEKYEYLAEDCRQQCLYQKANETLGVQAAYLGYKLIGIGKSDTTDKDALEKRIPHFCLSQESGENCWKRYRDLQVMHLYKIRSAIIHNGQSMTNLSSGIDKDGNLVKDANRYYQPSRTGRTAKGFPEYVVTFEDLQKESKNLQFLSGNEYQRWIEKLPREPSKDDFVKMKDIPRVPGKPDAGTFMVVLRRPNGEIDYDVNRFEAAMKKYKEDMARYYKDMGKSAGEIKPPKDFKSAVDQGSRADFKEARALYVNSFNSLIQDHGIQSNKRVEFTGPGGKGANARQPAAGRDDDVPENKQPERAREIGGKLEFRAVDPSPEDLLKLIDIVSGL